MITWKTLNSADLLDELIEQSYSEPIAIFKHSTSCSISAMAKKRLEASWNETIQVYYLDLIAYRSLSNEVSLRLGIAHESPQLLFIHNGSVVYHGSHFNISTSAIDNYIKELNSTVS
jgi:bacillithiol system protein YtxJ